MTIQNEIKANLNQKQNEQNQKYRRSNQKNKEYREKYKRMRKHKIPSVIAGKAKYWTDERIDDFIKAYVNNDETKLSRYQDDLL